MLFRSIAVAAAAKGSILLLVLGLAISIPLVIFGATILMKLMERYPVIITAGAGILGWVAGEMLVTDPAWKDWIENNLSWLHAHIGPLEFNWLQVAGAVLVIVVGKHLAKKAEAQAETEHKIVDLAAGDAANQSKK